MNKTPILIFLFSVCLFSCNNSHQYDVYVVNKSGVDLKVAYKSETHKGGPIEEVIQIKNNERRLIISTSNIKSNTNISHTSADHCDTVAEYVNAFIDGGIPSKLKWCSKSVNFQVVDMGQGEFTMEFTAADF